MENKIDLKKPISNYWKNLFLKYTDYTDIASVQNETNVGFHTIKRLRLGEINISNENNKKALEKLAAKAIERAATMKESAGSDEGDMRENISNLFQSDLQEIYDVI